MRATLYRQRPLSAREFIFSMGEWRAVAGINKATTQKYKRQYTDFPRPPTTKHAIWAFLGRHRLGRSGFPPGPPSPRRRQVIELRQKGWTFRAIAAELGMSGPQAYRHWKAYVYYLKWEEERRQRAK